MTNKNDKLRCEYCREAIEEGMEVLDVQEGVVGLSGFVPLSDGYIFCSAQCLKGFYLRTDHTLPKAPKRRP